MVIVAQDISPEIKQTSLYLRKRGIEIYCIEFKYFINKSEEKILSSNFVVGDDEFIKQKIKSVTQLPKVDKDKFLFSLNDFGKLIFEELFKFAEKKQLMLRWGSKGFSLNLTFDSSFVGLCFGYPPNSVFKQSIYSGFDEILRKVNNAENIVDFYKQELEKMKIFEPAKSNLKWVIKEKYPIEKFTMFSKILAQVIEKIKVNGLKSD